MSEHPASYLLEEVAAGGGDPATVRHIETCSACQRYVERLKEGASQFESSRTLSPQAFADRVAAKSRASRKPMWLAGAAAVGLTAAAALLLILLQPVQPPSHPTGPIAMLTTSATGKSDLHFKGKPQLAIVRLHDEQQSRMGLDASVHAGDRFRVEISIDAPALVEIGVLSEDGSWVTLLAASQLTPGTHFTPKAVHFDNHPQAGWVIAGAPEAVAKARKTRVFEDVSVLSFHVEKEK